MTGKENLLGSAWELRTSQRAGRGGVGAEADETEQAERSCSSVHLSHIIFAAPKA